MFTAVGLICLPSMIYYPLCKSKGNLSFDQNMRGSGHASRKQEKVEIATSFSEPGYPLSLKSHLATESKKTTVQLLSSNFILCRESPILNAVTICGGGWGGWFWRDIEDFW